MANYATLRAAIQNVVKTNGNNEITGALLQQSLLAMIDSLGNGYMCVGIATPTTNPGTPDQNVFYIAGPGTYSNFNSLVVPDGNLGVLKYNGSWSLETVAVGKNYDDDIENLEQGIAALNEIFDYKQFDLSNAIHVPNAYIRYSDGRQIAAGVGTRIHLYKIPNNGQYSFVKVHAGAGDTVPAIIAFYSQDAADTELLPANCLGLIQAQVGVFDYDAPVPVGTKTIAVSNRIVNVPTPLVYTYADIVSETVETELSQRLDDEIIFERNVAATSYSISQYVVLRNLEKNAKIKIVIDGYGGTGAGFIAFQNSSNVFFNENDLYVGKEIYLEQDGNLDQLRFYKASGGDNIFNFRVILLKDNNYPVDFNMYSGYLRDLSNSAQQISLKRPFSGYYNTTDPDTKVNSNVWVTWEKEYSCGYKMNVSTDWTQYVILFSYASIKPGGGNRITQITLTADKTIDTSGCLYWILQIRKTDSAAITPDDVENAISLTYVSGTKYLMPADRNTMQEIAENAGGTKDYYFRQLFANRPYYYHFAPNGFLLNGNGNRVIASESLEDIRIAARLGFSFIEANIHALADRNFVVIHGDNGKFGQEVKSLDEAIINANTTISSATLANVKQYLRYNGSIEKNNTTIPSLEEFCRSCKAHNIGIFAGTGDQNAIAIIREIMGDNFILYNPGVGIRDIYNGYVFTWNNTATYTIAGLINTASQYGRPYMLGIGPALLSALISNNEFDILLYEFHKRGYLVGIAGVYQTEEQSRIAFRAGIDFSGSGHEVNPFESNFINIDLDGEASQFTTTGTIANKVISLDAEETVTFGSANIIPLGKMMLTIRFNGELNIAFGSVGSRIVSSNGESDIVISDYLLDMSANCLIMAVSNTEITSLNYRVSQC